MITQRNLLANSNDDSWKDMTSWAPEMCYYFVASDDATNVNLFSGSSGRAQDISTGMMKYPLVTGYNTRADTSIGLIHVYINNEEISDMKVNALTFEKDDHVLLTYDEEVFASKKPLYPLLQVGYNLDPSKITSSVITIKPSIPVIKEFKRKLPIMYYVGIYPTTPYKQLNLSMYYHVNHPSTIIGIPSLEIIPDYFLDNICDDSRGSGFWFSGLNGLFVSTSLKEIPPHLFDNIDLTDRDISSMFEGCSTITSNVPRLWERSDQPASHSKCFQGCVNAKNYDEIPDDWK